MMTDNNSSNNNNAGCQQQTSPELTDVNLHDTPHSPLALEIGQTDLSTAVTAVAAGLLTPPSQSTTTTTSQNAICDMMRGDAVDESDSAGARAASQQSDTNSTTTVNASEDYQESLSLIDELDAIVNGDSNSNSNSSVTTAAMSSPPSFAYDSTTCHRSVLVAMQTFQRQPEIDLTEMIAVFEAGGALRKATVGMLLDTHAQNQSLHVHKRYSPEECAKRKQLRASWMQ